MFSRYLRADAVDSILARIDYPSPVSPALTYWYLTDHLGSIRVLLDNAGDVRDRLTYTAFGQIASETDPTVRGRYAFTGREWDAEAELQYNRARYYDPAIGRWTGSVPIK